MLALAAGLPRAHATPAPPHVEGPDVPAVTAATTVTVFEDERYVCTEQGRTRAIDVPDGTWDRIVLELTIAPDGDPWDRLFGVAIGGVEVMRGTTPRTAMTVSRDVTEYAALMPAGGTADVTLYLGTYIGAMNGTLRLHFYAGEPTAPLVRAPSAGVIPALLWRSLSGNGSELEASVTFPDAAPTSAWVELTLSGHGQEGEFWYLGQKRPRIFHVLVDGQEIATASAMPYVYALLGFGNDNANGDNGCIDGTDELGDTVHPLMWWTAQRGLNAAGVHTGDGEIPPYRALVDPGQLALLSGARTVEVRMENGSPIGARWVTSLAFLLT